MNVAMTALAALILLLATLALLTWWITRQAERQAPPIGQFAEVNGARLHYLDQGSGPAIVALHGVNGNLRDFYRLIDRLAENHRVIAIDRPGCGYSVMLSGPQPPLRAQASLVAALMDRIGVQEATVVGHSLGGALALALALDHSKHVRSLALIAPLSQAKLAVPRLFKAFQMPPALRRLIAYTSVTPVSRLVQKAALTWSFAPDPPCYDYLVQGGGVLSVRPGNFLAAAADIASVRGELLQMVPRYGSLNMPVHIIFGRQDACLDGSIHGERLAESIPHAKLRLIDGGHLITVAAADAVYEMIRQAAREGYSPADDG
ncbi:alpha/beta fold hydrolase [Dyella mobilis]|uniref:Alpha/beta fold hydrolase n=1 Tax=Dyella mobilis TaxID=1849582 RepID=A0ABS2KB01_9GAMM|nr:alpha/beta fold hydrolase [Dyella mobilis]MBM7128361.1 alpha/beta fold hydrolase [Dyella mobilis]GLQ99665.1 alpha/beta hydrolase [Dyella mobilis]